jgi:hypothetical protein
MFKIFSIVSFSFLLVSCKKEIPDNCEGEYSFNIPYSASHPLGIVNIGEQIEITIAIPFNVFNNSSDSMVNISRFSKILCGLDVEETKRDSTQLFGMASTGVNDAFKFTSNNVKLDFTPGTGGRNRVRYYLKKEATGFTATIVATPLRKGIFMIGIYNGLIEDAFCNAGINCYWGNFTSIAAIENLEFFLKLAIPIEIRQAMMLNNQAYFIWVE